MNIDLARKRLRAEKLIQVAMTGQVCSIFHREGTEHVELTGVNPIDRTIERTHMKMVEFDILYKAHAFAEVADKDAAIAGLKSDLEAADEAEAQVESEAQAATAVDNTASDSAATTE